MGSESFSWECSSVTVYDRPRLRLPPPTNGGSASQARRSTPHPPNNLDLVAEKHPHSNIALDVGIRLAIGNYRLR